MIRTFSFPDSLPFNPEIDQKLRPAEPSVQWVPRFFPLGAKPSGREADHLPPSSADVNECTHPVCIRGMYATYAGNIIIVTFVLLVRACSCN